MRARLNGLSIALLLTAMGCGPGGDANFVTSVPPEEQGPCGSSECPPGAAGLRFVNASGDGRNVYVDGELVCRLAPEEECDAAIAVGHDAIIHVTDTTDRAVCKDPSASLGECVCMTLEIRC